MKNLPCIEDTYLSEEENLDKTIFSKVPNKALDIKTKQKLLDIIADSKRNPDSGKWVSDKNGKEVYIETIGDRITLVINIEKTVKNTLAGFNDRCNYKILLDGKIVASQTWWTKPKKALTKAQQDVLDIQNAMLEHSNSDNILPVDDDNDEDGVDILGFMEHANIDAYKIHKEYQAYKVLQKMQRTC